ncbi:MAG: Calx-beta domain-containing protein, partial [Hominisplanchenecus sp.]
CLDMDCPYHYPEIIQEQMAEDEIPELLTLDDLVEEYGVEPPMQTFSRLRSISVPHPQTLMLTEDNENNSHTGSPDGDIDTTMSARSSQHPIEISFTLNEVPAQSAYLAIKAYDVDEDSGETDYVYINDDIYEEKDKTNSYEMSYHESTIGYLSGTNCTWNTTILRIPLEKLKTGKNTISITIASGWIVKVDWMQLILDGGAKDPNIEEFSLKLEDTTTSENNVTVQSSVTVRQTGNANYTTEYTLTQNATGNALDACFGSVLDSETIELSMPLSSPSGIYTITGILKDPETEQIKATDSVSFYFLQNTGVGPKISHTLTPDGLTNQDVTIQMRAEAVPEVGITDVSVPETTKTVQENGSYSFTVNYTMDGNSHSVSYTVNVDNIDKVKPVIAYSAIAVSQGEAYEMVKKLFADHLSVSDNGTLASEPLSYTIPEDISQTGGEKTITVTASDAAGNTTTKDCTITVIAKPVKLTLGTLEPVSGSKDSYTLKAVLDNGSDTITETGFVWGVMPNPTLDVKNGSVKTASVVKTTGQSLTATATGLISGVQYYARAYATVTENGTTNTVYSAAVQFGFDIPSYGTFSVSSVSGSTFTITRSGGTDGQQTVYYRTVNGSAIGGTHFTHQAGTLTFNDGETSKTVKVTENEVTSAYNSDNGTRYSNAARTYSLEIYRVEGGGSIDQDNRSETRTMPKNSSYTIDRSVYTTEKTKTEVASVDGKNGKRVADTTSDQGGTNTNVRFLTNRDGQTNYNTSSGFSTYYTGMTLTYLKATANGWYYRYVLRAYEEEDGYEHAYIGKSPLADTHYTTEGAGYPVPGLTGQLWACTFQQGEGSAVGTYNFPATEQGGGENSHYPYRVYGTVAPYNGKQYIAFGIDETCYCYFGANGAGKDIWYVDGLISYALVKDTQEPVLLGVAPMAGGTYLPGDPITVALVFDEIVDSQNSTFGNVSINTNVGTLTYAGGADTNVLYFTGTVASTVNLSGDNALQVTGINNITGIKDMNSLAGGEATFVNSSTNVIVDTSKPTVTITANTSGSLPQHKATITATNAKTIQYTWTQSTTLPVYGWSNVDSGTTLTESCGTAGATETWYLHVLATSSSGATTHTYRSFTFKQPDITAVSVRAGTSSTSTDVADVWKPFKYIVVTYQGAQTSGTTLTFAGPDSSSQTISAASGTKYLKVTKKGTYTVTLKDNYGNVISKTIEVKKIDTETPTVTLRSGNSTDPETVYNSLNIAVFPEDAGGSGLAKVEYAWTNTTAAPSTWKSLTAASDGSYQAVYAAAETTKTAKYLQVKVTDGAGNVSSVVTSGPYQVIKEATGTALPGITVTGNPASWTKSAVLTWTVTKGTGAIQTIYTPDGAIPGSSTSGSYTVTKNGIYQFVVMDENGNSAAAEVLVTKVDSDAPKLTSLTAEGGKTGTITLAGVTDNCTVIYDSKGNYSSISGSGLKSRQYRMEGESTWTTFTGDSISVSKNGTYIIKLTDNVNNSREYRVEVEGIDATPPKVTCTINAAANALSGWYTTPNLPVVLSFADEAGSEGGTPSGIKSVQYKWVTSKTTAPASGLTSVSASDIANGTVTAKLGSQGIWYLYYRVTDQKGNVTEGFSNEIKKDTFSTSLVISGPSTGQPISSGLAMKSQVTYGPSGGRITGGLSADSATLLAEFDQSTGT